MTELDRTLELYRAISPRVTRAITNSATFQDGYPTGGGSGGSGPADHRTAETALVHAYGREDPETGKMTGPRDPHGADRKALEATIQRLADLVDRLAPSNKAQDHLATQASDACPPGCCESCFRDGGHRSPTKNPGGKMCKWCLDYARELKADMPPLMLVQRHNRGQRITDRDIRAATGGRA